MKLLVLLVVVSVGLYLLIVGFYAVQLGWLIGLGIVAMDIIVFALGSRMGSSSSSDIVPPNCRRRDLMREQNDDRSDS